MYMLRVTTMLCGMYTAICVHNMLRVTTLCCYAYAKYKETCCAWRRSKMMTKIKDMFQNAYPPKLAGPHRFWNGTLLLRVVPAFPYVWSRPFDTCGPGEKNESFAVAEQWDLHSKRSSFPIYISGTLVWPCRNKWCMVLVQNDWKGYASAKKRKRDCKKKSGHRVG